MLYVQGQFLQGLSWDHEVDFELVSGDWREGAEEFLALKIAWTRQTLLLPWEEDEVEDHYPDRDPEIDILK